MPVRRKEFDALVARVNAAASKLDALWDLVSTHRGDYLAWQANQDLQNVRTDDEIAALQAKVSAVEGDLVAYKAVQLAAWGEQHRVDDAQSVQIAEALRRIADLEPEPEEPDPETMRVGSSLWRKAGETYSDAFERRARDWGVEPEVVRFFFTNLPTSWPRFGSSDAIVSFKGDPARVIAGDFDAEYLAFFRSVPTDGRPKRWCYWHEPEDNFTTKAQSDLFRAAFDHVYGLAESVANPDLQGGPILMAWSLDQASGRNPMDYVPARRDYIGFDAYAENPTGAANRYQKCKNLADSIAVPWLLGETARAEDGNVTKPEFIAGAAQAARARGCVAWCYYDSMNNGHDYALSTQADWDAIAAEVRK